MRSALRRAAISSSLLLAAGFAFGGDFTSLAQRVRSATSPEHAIEIVRASKEATEDPDISVELSDEAQDPGPMRDRLLAMIELRALPEHPIATEKAVADAKAIKRSSLFQDTGTSKEGGNWLMRALARLRNIHLNLKMPEMPRGSGPISGDWVVYLLWGLLAVGVSVLAFFAFRHLDWKRRIERRAKAMLDEEEPIRTLDEWLNAADEFAAAGQHRKAVRALYLACLLQFDKHRVARFERHETNWEHLRRIEASDRLPEGLSFREPTKAFDRIWYGEITSGLPDVERFRAWYQQITMALGGRS